MNVDVIVPLGGECAHRRRAWEWVRGRYRERFPCWGVLTGTVQGPWSKGAAVADALDRSGAPVVVIADADVWVDDLARYVDAVTSGLARWAMPHRRVFRFTERATEEIIWAGEDPADVALQRGTVAQTPYTALVGGGIVIITRDLYDDCPLDPRFVGWGGEDHAWGFALSTLGGRRAQGTGPIWHLWHPPAERLNRRFGSEASEQLRARYQAAGGDVAATRALIEEGQAAWASTSSS